MDAAAVGRWGDLKSIPGQWRGGVCGAVAGAGAGVAAAATGVIFNAFANPARTGACLVKTDTGALPMTPMYIPSASKTVMTRPSLRPLGSVPVKFMLTAGFPFT